MIYLAAAVVILTIVRFTFAVRAAHSFAPLRDLAWAVVGGLAGGVLLGIAARGGMAAITMINGSTPRITAGGTTTVMFTFIGMGGAIGIAYAGLFGRAIDRRGFAFGVLLAITTAYPLARAGLQLIAAPPSPWVIAAITALVVCLMWIPYALVMERIVLAFRRLTAYDNML